MERCISLAGGGRLVYKDMGMQIQIEMVRPDDRSGLYKAWMFGPNGRMLLGTMMPEGGRLCLRRMISRRTLEMNGCYPPCGGEAVMAFLFQGGQASDTDGWEWEEQPAKRLSDPLLCECARKWGKFRYKPCTQGFCLAAPVKTQCEFPLIPIFCLGRLETICGNPHIVWIFDEHGTPIFPPE